MFRAPFLLLSAPADVCFLSPAGSLSANDLKVEGAKIIADLLKTNSTLTSIDLTSKNLMFDLKPVGFATQICKGLKSSTTLQTLTGLDLRRVTPLHGRNHPALPKSNKLDPVAPYRDLAAFSLGHA